MSSAHVSTTYDYLQAISRHTDFDVTYLHVTQNAQVMVDLDSYDVVFNNYCARLCFEGYVCDSYQEKLRAFKGLKIISVQDVYDRTNALRAAIADLGIHVVMVSAASEAMDYLFDLKALPDVTFIPTLTGFSPEPSDFGDVDIKPIGERSTVLAYRGRDIGPRYGTLGFVKYEIGRVGALACKARNMAHNIAMDEDSRIYGQDWFTFIASSRAMLGTDSGSNVVDFDGEIEAHFRKLREELGKNLPYEPHLPYVAEAEKHITMSEASPRIFECAAMKTAMVMLRGHYSGVIEAERHYIPLERDFSNIEDVLDRLSDVPALQAMVDRTYDDLIASDRFSYRQFGRDFHDIVTKELERRPHLASPTSVRPERASGKLKPWQSVPTASPEYGQAFSDWLALQSAEPWLPLLIKRTFSRVPIVARFTNRLK
jgi:hypothetical protein